MALPGSDFDAFSGEFFRCDAGAHNGFWSGHQNPPSGWFAQQVSECGEPNSFARSSTSRIDVRWR